MTLAQKKFGLVMLALLLILGVKSASTNIVKQWQLEQAQSHGEQRLLDYIGDVRKTLRRFYHLPYLITNELISQQLLSGNTSVMDDMQATLGKLDKAANTKGWYVLSSSGDVLVSSKDAENWNTHDGDAIVAKIHEQREGISIVTKAIGATPIYFLAAPIYIDLDIVGIVAVQIDLSVLADQWFANDELILFQNASGQYFLSSSAQYNADWLNAHPHITNAAQPIHLYNGTRLVLWNLQSDPYLAQSVSLDDLNWTLTYLTPMKSLYQTVNWISMSCVVAVLLLILLGTLRYEQYQKQISQRKLQEIVQESERRQRNMIQKTHVGLLLLDESGQIEEINPMAKRYFSLSELMVKNVRAWELFDIGNPNATIPLLLENLARNQELADITSVETMARRSDGSLFPILFSLTSVQWKDKRHYLVTILDISKRKKAEIALQTANQELQHRVEERTAELKSAQQELIDASKMAALGRMSSAITHELNQPLTGLRTLLSSNELLLARGETQLAQANMKLVHTLIDRMANMTTQLKSFAFNRPETLTPVSIPDALQEILRVHQARLDRVDVRVRMSSELPLVRGEEQRLRQVLGNLITNALDAMQEQPEAKLIISASAEAGKVMIRVRDNGCGIDEDKLTTIFEPFQTSKKMGEGLGLGLSITANSVRDMQGTIRAVNNPEGGMTFEVTLSASAETSNLAQ
ncbi:sensor histidine kinase [Vibrio fluvialis]|nr:sensor histidine kinase [Vibrio fluvialis]